VRSLQRYLDNWLKTIVAIALLALIAVLVAHDGYRKIAQERERELTSLVEAISTSLQNEYRHTRQYARFVARRPEIVSATRALLQIPRDADQLSSAPAQRLLRNVMQPLIDSNLYQGFFVIARDNISLASSRDHNLGTPNPVVRQSLMLARAWGGQTILSLPQRADVDLHDADGLLRSNLPTMFVITPIRDRAGGIMALLALRLNPHTTIFRSLEAGRRGDTGESYLFDRRGRLLSDSRFKRTLQRNGRMAPGDVAFGNFQLTPPDREVPTLAVGKALNGIDDVDVEGYTSYRGETVVGAWRWLPEHEIGVVVELGQREAFRGFAWLRNAVFGTTLAAAMLLIAVTAMSRGRQRVLEGIVERRTRALTEERARLDTLFEQAPHGLITLDEEQRITRFSACARDIFGYTENTVIGEPLAAILAEHLPQIDLDQGAAHIELNAQRSDGSLVPVELSISETKTQLGRFSLVIVRDISEPKRLEAAMRDEIRLRKNAEQRQRQLLDAAGEGIFGTDNNGIITFINPAGAQLLGYQPVDLIGRDPTVGAGLHPELFSADNPIADPTQFSEGTEETLLTRSDNTRFAAEYLRTPLMAEGRAQGAVVVFSDISARKRADQSLQLADNVFEHITEGVLVTDAVGNILRVNRALCDMVGYSADEIVGQPRPPYHSGEHAPVFYQQIWDALAKSGRWDGEIWNRRRNGDLFPTWQTIVAVNDSDGETSRYVSVTRDITNQKRNEQRIHRLAYFDTLTGLPNRELFNDRFAHAIQRAKREDKQVALLFLDLDRFKNVNDSLGHPVGDRLLQAVAERLGHLVRSEDTIARLGGDEFTILLESTGDRDTIARVAAKVVEGLSRPFAVDEHMLHIGTSVGISVYPDDGIDVTTLIKHADTAMYQAKAAGRSNFHFYAEGLSSHAIEKVRLEAKLHRAVSGDEFLLHYQPQFNRDGEIVGIEALLRWDDPDSGLVPPGDFIPLAEETGLIVIIGEWVLRTACATMRQWLDSGAPDMRMSVNLSGPQITRGDIAQTVADVLEQTGLPARHLELEVTETFVMDNADNAFDVLQRLRQLGVRIAIDDFGTGHSSLANLKRLPVDTLKIDRAFVNDVPHDADDVAIARAIIALAKQLQLGTVAEGVETEEQKRFLGEEGCETFQGFLLSRPMPAEDIARRWLNTPRAQGMN
jgi:diguanylate cyclase (GGDEF)-like protein/PAS domain S-box-containing protein